MSSARRQVLGVTALRVVLALVWVHLVAGGALRSAVRSAAGGTGWFVQRVVAPQPSAVGWAAVVVAGAVGVLLLTGLLVRVAAATGALLALALSWGVPGALTAPAWAAAVLVAAHAALLLVEGGGAVAVDAVRRGASPARLARTWGLVALAAGGVLVWVALGEEVAAQVRLVSDGALALGVGGWDLKTAVVLGAAAVLLLAGSAPGMAGLCSLAAVASGLAAAGVALGLLGAPPAAVLWFAALAVVAGACGPHLHLPSAAPAPAEG